MKYVFYILVLILLLVIIAQFGILLPSEIGKWFGEVVYGIKSVK